MNSDQAASVPDTETVTAGDLRAAIRARYNAAAGYAVFAEVRDATGNGSTRSADFIAVSTWPSQGLQIDGFELKSHRSDWLREMKDPAKADRIFGYCDHWYLVSGPNVAALAEIPSPWGWIEFAYTKSGVKLRTRKQAPPLHPAETPRAFLVSLLREAARDRGQEEIERAINDTRQAMRREAVEIQMRRKVEDIPPGPSREDAELLAAAKAFEKQTRIGLRQHGMAKKVKDALDLWREVVGHSHDGTRGTLKWAAGACIAAARALGRIERTKESKP